MSGKEPWPNRGTATMPPHATRYLEEHAIPRAAWRPNGLRYLDRQETPGVVSMGKDENKLTSDSIAIPLFTGGTARLLDPDVPKKHKFSYAFGCSGSICFAALPPKSKLDWVKIRRDPTIPVYWLEGPLKAMAFSWHSSLPAIAFCGLDGWGSGFAPVEDFSLIVWSGRRVVLVVDSDAARKPESQQSLRRQWQHLISVGASPSVIVVPQEDGTGKTDVNDFIAAHGIAPLLKVEEIPIPEEWGAEEATQELNRLHTFILNGGRAEIITEKEDPAYPGTKTFDLSQVKDLRLAYANELVLVGYKTTGAPILKSKFDIWMADPYRRRADRIWFSPAIPWGLDPKTRDFNLWQGWTITAHKPDAKHSWSLLKQHIHEVVANGDPAVAKYVIDWMAHGLQQPEKLPEVAIVMLGGEGTGKGILARSLGDLYGRHFAHLSTPQMLTGTHNDLMKDKLLVFADENFFAGDHAVASALKAMITEPTMLINPKYVNAFKLPNYRRFIIASNESWAIPAGPDARRYAVFQVSEARKEDHSYFAAIMKQLKDGGLQAMLYELQHRDLTGFEPRHYPQTKALFEQKKLNFDPTTQWWFHTLCNGTFGTDKKNQNKWEDWITRNHAHAGVAQHAPSSYDKRSLETKVGIQLRKLCPAIKDTRRYNKEASRQDRGYQLPSLDECRKAFERYVRSPIDWDTGEMKRDHGPNRPRQPRQRRQLRKLGEGKKG
jgi:hypothetical protein